MTSSIYLTSSQRYSGKSTVALGILDALSGTAGRVGVFRPVIRTDDRDARGDHVLELLLERADRSIGLTGEDASGVTYDDVHADPDAALGVILSKFHELQRRCDTIVVVGSDFTDVAHPTEFAYNLRIAANMGAKVLMVLSGRDDALGARPAEDVAAALEVVLPEFVASHASLLGVFVNRADEEAADAIAEAVTAVVRNRAAGDDARAPVWVLPEQALLSAPTVRDLVEAVDGTLHSGDENLLDRESLGVVVAGMGMERVLERLIEGGVVIVAADRTETLLAVLLAHSADTFPSLAGVIVNGPFAFSPVIQQLLDGVDSNLPIIRCDTGTFETAQRVMQTRGFLAATSRRKIDVALASFERSVPGDEIRALLDVAPSSVVTPLMFEYTLLDRARRDRKHIVLPEGADDRILLAAGTLLAREVARLTILGDESEVRARAAELGADISDARVLSPDDPALVARFAEEYARLRAHKGMTVEAAADRVQDVSYFGTMMVHLGLADGMVSGAAHTTAHTIRPGFEIVRTKPGVSIVSSVFLMSLADRVIVYGDCAVNPDPTAEELADIAISSAATAAQFSITPRVAMLSYSTGHSGSGAGVEKVREATRIVRERRPDLAVEGPLQYDAAIDAAVAEKKLPGSLVAGQATVFVFPDLNTGNNTYKAVQRSAGAVAIGPVLQGLNKPINDLSRGALVSDIVNTVAITAIQAQNEAPTPTGAVGPAAVDAA
ncbi:phosphate acetyltransferase [Pseudoclavibacter endophyticus]|uniref:Phosphate acetyltransferase n=1 Tax=Pseudoclavibacter endophyticus TaxID=1778590 RepID=A0A6H9WQ28_9MICO|nr:phosphate acetyltransferase [Pseudoclavibacter endophyticus]KAB1648115.1 phosphate acetyltransferase [Pseudoclavibacter endophyticus]GGA69855.1 phosphate acetyltransferase [Pseudoclavibacter endophyticus]